MPFPGTWGTNFATILGGQQQANQASAAYNAQMQQRQLEDELHRAQLMMQLQDATGKREAISKQPADIQEQLRLGVPYEDILKRQAVSGRVNNWKSMIGQALIDPDRPIAEKKKLLSIYGSIDENSDPTDIEKQLKDFAGFGEKPERPFSYVDKDTGSPIPWTPGTPLPTNAVPEQVWATLHKGGAGDTTLKQVYHPETGKTLWEYVPKTGAVGASAGEVRPPMGANAIADADATSQGLSALQADIKSLKFTPGQSRLPSWLTVMRQKAGFAADDPRLTDMLAQVSVINTTLTGMVMRSWGTRNVAAAAEVIRLHVPKPEDSPDLINQKIDWWQRVGLNQYKTMLGAAPGSANPSEGTPVYVGGKLVGHTTDGKTMVPVP